MTTNGVIGMARDFDNSIDARTERLLLYLEGALDGEQCRALETELAGDAALTAELAQLRRVDARLGALAACEVISAERMDRAIWQASARMRAPAGSRFAYRLVRFGAVAAVLLLAVGAGYALRGLTTSGPAADRVATADVPADEPFAAVLASGRLQLVETGPDQSDAVPQGAPLAWGPAMVAAESSQIVLGESGRLQLDAGTVVRLLTPGDGRPRVEVSGGRWHLTGSALAGTVIVADGGTVQAESAELELISEPAEMVNGGGFGPTGVAMAVFSGVVTLSNANGRITVGAGEMAVASVVASPAKRVWEPSVGAYVDALTRWYELDPAQQYEVGQLVTELRQEQEWLLGPHEQELAELRRQIDAFWLSALEAAPGQTREYLENYARYRELQADSPYRLASILERVEAMLPAGQLSRAWTTLDVGELAVGSHGFAKRLGVSGSLLEYVRHRYRLTDEQLVELEQYLRLNRTEGESLQTSFDDLLAGIAAVVPAEQVRQADRQASLSYRRRLNERQSMLGQVLPVFDAKAPERWSSQVGAYAKRCQLTPAQVEHARQAADEVAGLAQAYSKATGDRLAYLARAVEAAGDAAGRDRLTSERDELLRPLRAWADQLRQSLATLPTVEQLELALQPNAGF